MYVQSKRTDEPPQTWPIFLAFIDEMSKWPKWCCSQPAAAWRSSPSAWAEESRSWCRRGSPTWASLRTLVSCWWSKIIITEVTGNYITSVDLLTWSCILTILYFSDHSGERTFQKVKPNKTGSTTLLNCHRSTLEEATWHPNRVLCVWLR